jgi:hypothetical protein
VSDLLPEILTVTTSSLYANASLSTPPAPHLLQVNKFAGPSTPLLSRMNSAIGGSSAPLPAEGVLHAREAALINHAMGLTTTTSRELLTPLAHVQSLPITAFMNAAAIADLVASGHGHVPVFVDQPHNVQYYFSLQCAPSFARGSSSQRALGSASRCVARAVIRPPLTPDGAT